MKYFTFNPFGNKSIIVSFDCDNCGHKVVSEEIAIPSPDYAAETSSDSQTEEEGYAICENEKCQKQFDISIYVTYSDGDGNINDLPDSYSVEVEEISEPYYEEQYEAISSNTQFFTTFELEIENLKDLNSINLTNPSTDKTLRRQIFVGVIASIETYLSDAFINTTLNSKEFTKKFVSSFHEFKERLIPLNELFVYHDKIETTCKKELLDIIYHNLPKVKGMYKDTLSVDLGDISVAYKAVLTRHDLVHRNGKTKNDKEVIIDKTTIDKLLIDMKSFVDNIDQQINDITTTE